MKKSGSYQEDLHQGIPLQSALQRTQSSDRIRRSKQHGKAGKKCNETVSGNFK